MPLLRLYFIATSLVAADHIIFHDVATTSTDVNNECVCSMELPDTAFPSYMVSFLDDAYKNFTTDTEHEEEKVDMNNNRKCRLLLNDQTPEITIVVADFLAQVIKEKEKY